MASANIESIKETDMVTIEFETYNAAFAYGNRGAEISRILRDIADRLEPRGSIASGDNWMIRDDNGNIVGEAYVSPKDED